ncbi:hypothetical protein [Klenkia sp. PcliD-1-E]|uniref:hypothetical protein n=1 Tax=Klenkia sp. PcliD-1-E TaxID=2954492 RepID=UPI002096C1F9|nr:hypothetical protein [Klenkia sp. PcliD-1-E]MCO7220238.1 hypothetical protein [Klenkia sp. PcliD-1-E]
MTAPVLARPTARRRPVRAPRGFVLVAAGLVVAEAVGWAVRVLGAPPPVAAALGMDPPWSVPRTMIALVFTAGAVAAWVGAVRLPQRRTWWTAVAVLMTMLALVKAGSTVHVEVLHAIGGDAHPVRGLVVLGGAGAAYLGWLLWLSRHERRDRRRVLTWLALYGAAAIGLSTGSQLVESWAGWASVAAATSTFVEESCEAVAAVGVLFAVLLGAAPARVLPGSWRLRRAEDAAEPLRG